MQILKNFAALSTNTRVNVPRLSVAQLARPQTNTSSVKHKKYSAKYLAQQSHVLFDFLFGGIVDVEKFWLDSSRAETGLSRFSYMGAMDGPHSEAIKYHLATRTVTVSTKNHTTEHHLSQEMDFFDFIRSYMKEKGYFHDGKLFLLSYKTLY